MKRLWQRHMLVRAADKYKRQESALEAMGGMMGGFFQGLMGASLAQRLSEPSPDILEAIKDRKKRERKH